MSVTGTYKGYLCFMDGELYVGMKDGQPHIEYSVPRIGTMHDTTKNVSFTENGISFIMDVNNLDGVIELQEENGHLTGEMYVKEVDMRFKVDMEKTSEEYSFCDLYYVITEENREILRTNSTYLPSDPSIQQTYDLGNQEVLDTARELGIVAENHHDFATVYELMMKTASVIHQDGVNYAHNREERGTLAQLRHAMAQNNMTNCRGISILFSGILRAYGFRSSYVECWPADPKSKEIHVVCEVYIPELHKFVAVDISNWMIFYKDGTPMSLLELREAIAAGEDDRMTCNENARYPLTELLAYLSKNLVVFSKQRDNNETSEIEEGNSICLVPAELAETIKQNERLYVTSNPLDFYSITE